MGKRSFCFSLLNLLCIKAYAQRLLFVNPGGIVEYKNNSVAFNKAERLSKNCIMRFQGIDYPIGGDTYFEMVKENSRKYNAKNAITISNNKIFVNGKQININAKIIAIEMALFWEDKIACIGIIPHVSKRWLEPETAYALIIISPATGRGAYKGLYLAGKADCEIWMVDPVPQSTSPR